MIYIIIGLSVLFILVGFTVTEKNAKHLLSGYNTMSEEDREKVDLTAYIPYFRNFHFFLGITFFIFGASLTYFVGRNAGGLFLGIYPIVAYIYFIATSSKYSKGLSTKWNKFGIVILSITLVFVVGLFAYGYTENRISYDANYIEFSGSYGENISVDNIAKIELVNTLPKITSKTNGFAMGTVNKGYFRTKNGEIVKLILNSDQKPIILLTKTNGKKIYFSAETDDNQGIYDEMGRVLPGVVGD